MDPDELSLAINGKILHNYLLEKCYFEKNKIIKLKVVKLFELVEEFTFLIILYFS